MGIISTLLALAVLASFVGLFFKRFRKRAFLLLVASFAGTMIVGGVELERQNTAAREAGFLDHQDFIAAQEAGTTSSETWNASRAEREAEAAEQVELARLARECGDQHSVSAFVMSQRTVTANLRAPSTAEFPSINAVNVSPVGDCRYVVSAFVDAQNGFGAQIRTPYRAVMERDPESGGWRLLELEM